MIKHVASNETGIYSERLEGLPDWAGQAQQQVPAQLGPIYEEGHGTLPNGVVVHHVSSARCSVPPPGY